MKESSVLTCLSDDGELFAVVSSDQRVNCFQTSTGARYGDQIRLPSGCIPHCITTRHRLLAIGMSSGVVIVCDLSKSEILHQTNAHNDCIHDLCFTSDATTLYMCSNDGACSEWLLDSSRMELRRQFRPSKRSIMKSIAITQDDTKLACGSGTIYVMDTSSLKTMVKLRGHANDLLSMSFNSTGDVLYTIADGDRTVNAFRIPTGSKHKEKVDAKVCYMGTDHPRTLVVGSKALACVLQTGNIAIFDLGPLKKSSKQRSVTEFVLLNCDGRALAVRFVADGSVLVAGGHAAEPVFKSSLIDKPQDLPLSVINPGLEKAPKKRQNAEAPVEVVSSTVKKLKKEPTLAAITSQETLPLPLDDSNGQATADSMVTLLSQGLKSNDNQKLCLVLDQSRETFIDSTLARLPPGLIPSLVAVLVKRIRTSSKPKHLSNSMNWLACLLQRHTAYLLGNSAVAEQLSEAKLLLENRQRCASSLMALSGRLTMLHCQLERKALTQESVAQPTVFVHDVNEQ